MELLDTYKTLNIHYILYDIMYVGKTIEIY